MEPLYIAESQQTPEILFDGRTGLLKITGKSYPENVQAFYQPVFDYIEAYKSNPLKLTVEFNWLYYNTSTALAIVKIIKVLMALGNEFDIKWYCNKDAELMIQKGEEIRDVLGVDLQIIFNS